MRQRSLRLRAFMLASVLLAAACGDSAEPRNPGQIVVLSGNAQTGTVAQMLPAPIVVQVNDQKGKALSGASVTWSIAGADGTLSATTTATDRSGQAQVNWTLGTLAGAKQITASVGSVAPVTITATANPGAPSVVERAGGDQQSAAVGAALPTPVAVLVKDAHTNPVPNVAVTFAPAAGNGTVSAGSVNTNAQGRAQATWTLGGAAGAQRLTARVGSMTPLEFTATAAAGNASVLTRVTAVSQNGTVAQTMPLVVKVTDAHGNGVAGTSVAFAVTAGGGAVTPSTVTSGADGQATANWTLGTTTGNHTAVATAQALGGEGLTFTVVASAGAAAQLAMQNTAAAAVVGDTLRALVTARDQFGNTTALPTLTWTTSAAGVATVDQTGKITAVGGGVADITANVPTQPGVNATMRVTVAAPEATLDLGITGLPAGVLGNVTIRGPNNFVRVRTESGAVGLPAAGTYTIEAASAQQGTAASGIVIYAPTPATQTVNVAAGDTATASVSYALLVERVELGTPKTIAAATGTLSLYRVAVPAGMASLTVSTQGGSGDVDIYVKRGAFPTGSGDADCYSAQDGNNDSCTVNGPQEGDYNILLHAYQGYSNVTLRATAAAGGTIAFAVSGLPQGSAPAIQVTGPNSFNRALTSTAPLTGLPGGTYTILASNVVGNDGKAYAASPSSQQIMVTAGQTSTATIAYAQTQGGFNLDIAGVHITQAMQSLAGAVPLVANRDGLLRVFVRGSLANTSIPDVRVRLYRNGQLQETRTITAPSTSTPVSVDEGVLLSSWNYRLPGSMIQPGLAVVVDVDPTNAVTETNENDNTFPSNGNPLTFDVRSAGVHSARFVPVVQPNGLRGDVTSANLNTYVDFAHAVYPMPSIDADVRAPYSYSAMLASEYDNTWSNLLSEIEVLRIADGSSRYYYGVIKPAYTSGGTGLGYIGQTANPTLWRSAIGVDWANWRAETVAHEWGHNFGRAHVGCGNPNSPDANYPYPNGTLGMQGWDMRTNVIRSMTTNFELMSYCTPYWTSDYTYNAVMNFRATAGGPTVSQTAEPSLIVWGRTTPEGEVVLEPSFEMTTRPVMPTKSGRFRLELQDGTGAPFFEMSFDGQEVDHLEGVRHFAYAIPLSRLGGREAAAMRLTADGKQALRRRTPASMMAAGAGAEDVQLTRASNGRVRVQWDVARNPMVVVRDPRTGDVLSLARSGDQMVVTNSGELELDLSDGVKSRKRRQRVEN